MLILTVRLVDKFFSKNKYIYKFCNNLILKIKNILFRNLRSNHERRFLSVKKLLNKNIKVNFFFNLITKLEDDNLSFIFWPKLNFKRHVYLVGDSHSEFYCRCSRELLEANGVVPNVLWLGPRTIMGMFFSGNIDTYIKCCFLDIEHLEKGEDISDRYFAFSFGSIDIRTLFTQLTKFGPKISQEELMNKFRDATQYFFEDFIFAFKHKWPGSQLGIFEVVFPTDCEGELFSSEKDLKNFLRVMPYPILGSHAERLKWLGGVNEILMATCKKMDIDFLPVNRHLGNQKQRALTNIDSLDNTHITNQTSIDAIFLEIMNRMRLKNVD